MTLVSGCEFLYLGNWEFQLLNWCSQWYLESVKPIEIVYNIKPIARIEHRQS